MPHRLALVVVAIGLAACRPSAASEAGGDVVVPAGRVVDSAQAQPDTVVRNAQRAIEAGHPWLASRQLAPVLADPRRRTPDAVLVAARAAAGWEGWTEVDRLLARESWIDSRFDGEPRELLTRSALGRDRVDSALAHASAALTAARTDTQRMVRSVLLARALDRARLDDSAAAMYRRAASLDGPLAPVRGWLALRAAGVTRDARERARLYASISSPAARARVDWTEAQALERSGDAAASADRFEALGDRAAAARLRLGVARTDAERATARAAVIAAIRDRAGTALSRDLVALLDASAADPPLTPGDELGIARALATIVPARALASFDRARSAAPLSGDDQFLRGLTLSRAGRTTDAIAAFERIDSPPRLAAQAAYQRARLVLTSRGAAAARADLRAVVTRHAADTATASSALYLLADLLVDASDDAGAAAALRELYRRYPTSARAATARFQAAIIEYSAGRHRVAALALDSLATLYPRSSETLAARYWSGRAWSALQNTTAARARWRAVIDSEPLSYYTMRARERSGERWTPPANGSDATSSTVTIDSAVARVRMLRDLGMDVEARFEIDALDSAPGRSRADTLHAARALRDVGEVTRSARIGLRLLQQAPGDGDALRLAYPVVDREALERESRAHRLDPALVAGLIRQESAFDPRAVSVAGARGLMQVMPDVGAAVARGATMPHYTPALLFDADANLALGMAHLAASMRRHTDVVRVLAAYNAGESRVTRWATRAGVADPELFAERIPYVETRDYVRIVQRNAWIYRALYGFK